MKVTHFTPASDQGWAGRVDLDEHEWPPIDLSDAWLSRPIREWVHENCTSVSFSYYGMILFGNRDDLIQFVLTWS